MRGLLRQACLGLCFAVPLAAQTNDPIFARWRWNPDQLGSRPAGIGGAFVAVADNVKAAYANPAGLTLIPVREIGLSSGRPWLGGAAGGPRLRVAAYLTQVQGALAEWDEPSAVPGVARGFIDPSIWEAGLAVGVQPVPRVRIGASLAWSRLRLEGEDVRSGLPDGQTLITTVHAESSKTRLAGGVLIDLVGAAQGSLPSLRLGIAYQPGFDWSVQVRHGRAASAGSAALRRPSLIAAGMAYRPTDRWSFSAQGDVIRYSEVVDALRRNVGDATGFGLPDSAEPRLGAEFASPLWCGCGVAKLRAGLHYQSPGTLRYRGSDPVLAAAFSPTQWRTVLSFGGSLFGEYLGNAVRLDVDSKDVLEGPDLSFGIVWRF